MSSSLEPNVQVQPLGRSRVIRIALFLLVIAAVLALFITRGIQSRVQASANVEQATEQLAVPAVVVTHPAPGKPTSEISLTGALQAYSDAPIYARASGYIKEWHANIGDHVKEGEVLAEIEAPELDLQFAQAQASVQQARASLQQAQANMQQAKANEDFAKISADRWAALVTQGLVAPQDNDQRQGQYKAAVSNRVALEQAIDVARANIAAQEATIAVQDQLRSYRTVRAPFDGVVTARRTDVGALVTAGSNTNTIELFHMAATDRLRLFVSIPELFSGAAVPGLTADITLEEFQARRFPARLVRVNGALDASTRTLLCEFEVDNKSGQLRAGAYAEVHLTLPSPGRTLLVPVSSVMFRPEGPQVGIIGPDGKVKLTPVTIGKDYGSTMEIVAGVGETDQIVESPPDSLMTGMEVRVIPSTGK
jgi:RND family efflux transporter MFP subunit